MKYRYMWANVRLYFKMDKNKYQTAEDIIKDWCAPRTLHNTLIKHVQLLHNLILFFSISRNSNKLILQNNILYILSIS